MDRLINQWLKTKIFPLKSQGLSMAPFLLPDDVVYFKKISFNHIKINNIIIFKKRGHLISHRVIYKTKKYLITKGDNNPQSDGKIYPRQIIGRVYQVKRNNQIFHPENLYLLQSTLYFQEIIKIKEAFEKEKIDFVFLKGLPLHLYFENNHPKRIYLDCDVLVNPKDFSKAEKIILRFGYKKRGAELSSFHKKMRDKEIENAYFKIINGFAVVFDLHLEVVFMMTQLGKLEALYRQKLINELTDEFLKTKKTVKINNELFFILNTKYLILYLALHFFHHNFRGAFRLEFLDFIIRKSLGKKWDDGSEKLENEVRNEKKNYFSLLASVIKKYHLQNFVYPVFILLKKLYQTPIPPQFLKSIQPSSFLVNNYLKSIISDLKSVFDDEPRIKAGINRFKNLFFLSPHPWWKRLLVFFNRQVIYTILWILIRKMKLVIRSGKLVRKIEIRN